MALKTESVPPIVSTSWLKERLSDVPGSIMILDATLVFFADGKEHYLQEHLPKAVHFDVLTGTKSTPFIPRNVPAPELFQKYAQSLGIDKNTHVVLYDRGEYIYYIAARAWWTFRLFGHEKVSVLNGGLEKWKADGYEVATGDAVITKKGDFEASFNRGLMITYDEMIDTVRNKTSQIVDTRKAEHFHAEQEEPNIFTTLALQERGLPVPTSDKFASGHHPGAINFQEHLLEDKKILLDKSGYLKLCDDLGIDLTKKITTTCYIGHGACILALALAECGIFDTAVYHGSWTEYGQKAPAELVENPRKKQSPL